MNERILNLARIAQGNNPADYAPDDNVILLATQDVEKFAELIVRECAKVSEDDITDGDACCTNTAYRIARQIKKHFGVE
jgi:aminoglycoside phosphotransferase